MTNPNPVNMAASVRQQLKNIVAAVRAFVMPILEAIAEEKDFEKNWIPGGRWRD